MSDANSEAWQQVLKAETGHVFEDYYEQGVRVLIMRGPSSVCVYLGVQADHPLAGFSYDDLPLSCHGGLTFAAIGKDRWPTGWYWYGWDYAHSGDRSTYDDQRPPFRDTLDETRWTVEAAKKEVWNAVYDFAKLKALAEQIVSKRYRIAVEVEQPVTSPIDSQAK